MAGARGTCAGLDRTTVNQFVALIVFMYLLCYAHEQDLLFKPDPAVPIKGPRPKKEKGEHYFLFPSEPAIYVTAPSAEAVQPIFENDHAAMRLVRKMCRVYTKHYTGGKEDKPAFIDVGSPFGTWGIYMASMGVRVTIMQPRLQFTDRVQDSIYFSKYGRQGKAVHRILGDLKLNLRYNATTNAWRKPKTTKHDSTTEAVVSTPYETATGARQGFMLHIGVGGAVLPALRGVLASHDRPMAVLADYSVGAEAVLDFEDKSPQEAAGELAGVAEKLHTMGYSLKVLNQGGCGLDVAKLVNTTVMGERVLSVPPEHYKTFMKDVADTAAAATPAPPGSVCRLMWLQQPYFERTEYPIIFIAIVVLKLLCVLFVCIRGRKKATSYSQ